MNGSDPVIYGIIGAIVTGIVTWIGMLIKYHVDKGEKNLDYNITSAQKNLDEAGQIRQELRESNKKLEDRIEAQRVDYEAKLEALRQETATWKDKYYQDTIRLQTEIAALKVQISDIKSKFLTEGDAKAYA